MDHFKAMCYIFCVWNFLILVFLGVIVFQLIDLKKLIQILGYSNVKELKDVNKNLINKDNNNGI
jgi:hypothetical protein